MWVGLERVYVDVIIFYRFVCLCLCLCVFKLTYWILLFFFVEDCFLVESRASLWGGTWFVDSSFFLSPYLPVLFCWCSINYYMRVTST